MKTLDLHSSFCTPLYFLFILVFLCTTLHAQELEIEGKAKITVMDLHNTADSVVVILADGTLARRDVSTLSEFQILSISNDTIFLTNGGFVKLPASNGGGWTLNVDTTHTQKHVSIGKPSTINKLEVFFDSLYNTEVNDQSSVGTGSPLTITSGSYGAQSFVVDTTGDLNRIEVTAKRSGATTANLSLEIRTGSDPASGSSLIVEAFNVSSVGDSIYSVVFTSPIAVTKNDNLVMIVQKTGGGDAVWERSGTDVYAGGNALLNASGWINLPTQDHWFKSYIELADSTCVSGFAVTNDMKVGIGTSSPNAALEINGHGLLPPRMSTTERDALTNLTEGLTIYNTTTHCLEFYWIAGWQNNCNSNSTLAINTLIGGSDSDIARVVQQTADGGYIVGGHSTSSASGDVSGTSNGAQDYWIVKLDSNGEIVWNTLIGGSSGDQQRSIQQTADGGYIVAGLSLSSASGDVSGTSNGHNDYWIVKLNSNGGIVWNTLIGGSGSDIARAIQQTADGGYIVAGYSGSSASGDVSGTSNGFLDYWIVKLDSNGGIVWDTLIGGSDSDIALSLLQTADGGYIVAGSSDSSASGDVSGTSNGGEDYWIVKLNSNGGIVWDTLIGGSGDDIAYSIQMTVDGGYIVAGSSDSSNSGDVSGTSNGSEDYWIVKLNSNGGIVWNTLIGGSGGDFALSMQQTADGGYIVAGYSDSSTSGDVSGTSNGSEDYWIVKLDSNGVIVWNKLIGGSGSEYPYSIQQTTDGGYIVAGSSDSSASGDVSGTSKGGQDYWIVTLDSNGNILE